MKCRFCAARFGNFSYLSCHIEHEHPEEALAIAEFAYGDLPEEERAEEMAVLRN